VIGSIDNTGGLDETVYDHVIFAADVVAAKNIFAKTLKEYENDEKVSNVLSKCVNAHIDKMKIAPDYRVLRIWFDKQLDKTRPQILETPDHTPINLSINIKKISPFELYFDNNLYYTSCSVSYFRRRI
jgi:hypothetical protein